MIGRAALLVLFTIGCGDPTAPAVDVAPDVIEPTLSSSATTASSVAELEDRPRLPVELPLIAAFPLASSATPEQRSDAVLDLLAGGEPATRLPIRATVNGRRFDHQLRDKVAPLTTYQRRGAVSVRMGKTTVSTGLPPEVVQRVVRQNFGRFRLCYENGLRSKPTMAGRVDVRFKITSTGTVESAKATGTDLSPTVVSCVEKAFTGLRFPEPEGGKLVTVVYPITFAPGS